MHNKFIHGGTLVRGEVRAKTGVSSQFNERALIHREKKAGNTVVRRKGNLIIMVPKSR
jgi:hypothetical protein